MNSNMMIKCPRCGAEYLPKEIYIPRAFFGTADDINKDSISHKVIDYCGTNMDTNESYICGYCNVPFLVSARVTFSTKEDKKHNFTEDYKTKLVKEQIFLSED